MLQVSESGSALRVSSPTPSFYRTEAGSDLGCDVPKDVIGLAVGEGPA